MLSSNSKLTDLTELIDKSDAFPQNQEMSKPHNHIYYYVMRVLI